MRSKKQLKEIFSITEPIKEALLNPEETKDEE